MAGTNFEKINKFTNNIRGNLSTVFAVLLPAMGVAIGVAVDYSRIENERFQLQDAIDSAVLSAALAKGSKKEREARGNDVFFVNSSNPCDKTPTYKFGGDEVEASAACTVSTTFLGLAGFTEVEIEAVARAGFSSSLGFRCLHALDSSVSKALIYNNKRGPLMYSGDSIVAPTCDVQVNSASSKALLVKDDESYRFARHCLVGGVKGDIDALRPLPDPACKNSVPDPLATHAVPAHSGCSGGVSSSGGTVTLSPGTYCGGISESEDRIVLKPGVYHVTGGDVELEAEDSIAGDGVTFVMHPGSGAIEIESEARLDLRAPSTGPTVGFLVFDRNDRDEEHLFKTSDNDVAWLALDGIIYAPEDHVELFWKRAGTGANEKPIYFRNFGVIANTIDLHGYNQLYIETPDPAAIGGGLLASPAASNNAWLKK